MALFLQTQENSGEILKSGKAQGNFFWSPIFWFFNWLLNKLSVILLCPRQDVKLPTGKRFRVVILYWKLKIGRKYAEVFYELWSADFLLVKNSGKNISICCSTQGKWHGHLNENSVKILRTFLSELWREISPLNFVAFLSILMWNDVFEVDFYITTCAVPWNSFFCQEYHFWSPNLFPFILCVTELAIKFLTLIILSYDMHKPKSDMCSTKYLLRVDLWRRSSSPSIRRVSLIWLYALSLLLWESYCTWWLFFIMFITNSDKMFTDFSISVLGSFVSESFVGPHKIQRSKRSKEHWNHRNFPCTATSLLLEFLSWQFLLLERYFDSYRRNLEISFQQLYFNHSKNKSVWLDFLKEEE